MIHITKNHYVGIDSSKGFFIFIMIFVHQFIHQVANSNQAFFMSLVGKVSIIELILGAPFALLSVMGTGFLFYNTVAITVQMLRIAKHKPEQLPESLKRRILSSILFIAFYRLGRTLVQTKYFQAGRFYIPQIWVRFDADTLDAIGISAIIISFMLYFLFKVPKILNQKWIFVIFLCLVIVLFLISNPLVIWGQKTMIYFHEHELYFLEFLLSKFALGRFKLFQTLGFGFLGVCFACLLELNVSKSTLWWFSIIINGITFPIFLIWSLIDPSFLQDFASEEVPLPIQILLLGLETIIFLYFIVQCDYGPQKKQEHNAKRMKWLQRFGIVSLTIYTIHDSVNDQLFRFFALFWGPVINTAEIIPVLAWNSFQIFIVVGLNIIFWLICLYLWEKIEFRFSLDWLLHQIVATRGKKPINSIPSSDQPSISKN